MRVLVATDAWSPQINGVVFALQNLAKNAASQGCEIEFLTPEGFRTIPMPTYPEIPVALVTASALENRLRGRRFDHVHIATEGPIGLAMRRLCRKHGWLFTTSFHTRFPEYLRARFRVPLSWTYAWLRRFHNAGICTMVSTQSLQEELSARGFRKLSLWSRGVDQEIFSPQAKGALPFPPPIFLYVGRVAIEKDVAGFLALDLPGTKVIVGDGPERARLEQLHPDAVFLGAKTQSDLAAIYSSANVLVFPSKTDTFGMVMIEALACGLPVAAYPVPGPNDILANTGAGILDPDLRAGCLAALAIPSEAARAQGRKFTWEASARQFTENVRKARAEALQNSSHEVRSARHGALGPRPPLQHDH